MRKAKALSPDILRELYFVRGLSHRAIAREVGLSEPTVRARFHEYGFIPRKRGSWMVKYPKLPFDGSNEEKAYMMGFRVGDMHVYRPSSGADIIVARTNSTQEEQFLVVRSLFAKYGGVIESGKGKAKNINCYLDESFSFLLIKKPYRIESWISRSRVNSLAFMAGYIDAEGNFIISQGRARFKLDAYDHEILRWMHEELARYGAISRLRLLANKGEISYNNTYKWKGDLWRLNVNEANSLLVFCRAILPHLRHRKRIADVQMCINNILERRKNGTIRPVAYP